MITEKSRRGFFQYTTARTRDARDPIQKMRRGATAKLGMLRRQTVEMVGVVNAHIIDAVKAEPSLRVETTESPTPRSMEVTGSSIFFSHSLHATSL